MPFINNIERTCVLLCRLYIMIMLLCKINCYYYFCLKVVFVPNTLSLQYCVIDTVYLCTRQYTALHQVIWTRCALQCPLCPTFSLYVPPLMVIWSYLEPGYNSATGHSVWLVRSPGTVYHLTFVRHLHYQRLKWCSRHICFLDPTSVTNCRPEYEQRTLCGALVVTLSMLLHLTNCRFIIIIIIITQIYSQAEKKEKRNGKQLNTAVYSYKFTKK